MARLANAPQDLQKSYEIVVIGSGYGGGVAASRLARAGRRVCILERGKEFQPSEYPNSLFRFNKETQMDLPARHLGSRTGLYDLRFNPDVNVFVGCGLGGTSLINGGVSLRVLPRVLADERWPSEIRAELGNGGFGTLDRYYRLAEDMLKPHTYPASYPKLPKMAALERVAAGLNLPFAPAPIAVNFEKLEGGVNHVGVKQDPCNACGDCASGCNYSAKSTLIMNYLPDAKNHGAEIYTTITVRYLERSGDRWLIHCQRTGSRDEIVIAADIVVVAAGTMGSNEILMRSREKGLALSDTLGDSFSGNGDMVGWSYNTPDVMNSIGFGGKSAQGRPPVGPFASGVIDAREKSDFLIIEGSFPGAMAWEVPGLLAFMNLFAKGPGTRSFGESVKAGGRTLISLLNPYGGATKQTQTYLVVNQDDTGGKLRLKDDRLRVEWPGMGKDPIFQKSSDTLQKAADVLGGTLLTNRKSLLTGHPSGGCHMADQAQKGVVDHKSRVYKGTSGTDVHPGLYVMDAAVIPRSIGVNPLLTISALAERSCHHLAADNGWAIDYSFPRAAKLPA